MANIRRNGDVLMAFKREITMKTKVVKSKKLYNRKVLKRLKPVF
ncbi:hypothetical protein ACPF04_06015 [Campylobacter sp. MOP51]